MLAVLSKLIYLLTLGPFSAEAGLLKAPEIERESKENEGLPSESKGRSGSRSRSGIDSSLTVKLEPRILSAIPGHSFLRDVGIVEHEQTMPGPGSTIVVGLIMSLIAHGILQNSEKQAIVFLVGYAQAFYLFSLVLGIIGLFIPEDIYQIVGTVAWAFVNFGGSLLFISLAAKVYYIFYPPPPPPTGFFLKRADVAVKN